MHRLSTLLVSGTALVISIGCWIRNSGAQQAPKAADATQSAPTLKLSRIAETRAADLVKPEGDDAMFTMASDKPGLYLTFALHLPAGVRVMDVHQPEKVIATDSEGTDLSKIEPGFGGELEYIDLEHDFKENDEFSEITLHLLPAVRKAMTFDANATFEAIVFTGVTPAKIDVGAEWSPLPAEIAQSNPKARIHATDNGIAIEPASLEASIEKIEIQSGPNEVVESNGWFADGTTITYMFDDMPKERPAKLTLSVRTGVKTVPLVIELKGQPLP